MARLEVFVLLGFTAVVSCYMIPNWGNPNYIFMLHDINGDGELDWPELLEMFPSSTGLSRLLRAYDDDMSGTLDRSEFAEVFPIYESGNLIDLFGGKRRTG